MCVCSALCRVRKSYSAQSARAHTHTHTHTHTQSMCCKYVAHKDGYQYLLIHGQVDCTWNVMAHVQKPDFVFLWNGRVHLNRRGALVQSTTGSRGVRVSGSNAGYTMFRGSVKGTGYPLHSTVSHSLPLPCITVCHRVSTGLYNSSYIIWRTYLFYVALRKSNYYWHVKRSFKYNTLIM